MKVNKGMFEMKVLSSEICKVIKQQISVNFHQFRQINFEEKISAEMFWNKNVWKHFSGKF